MIGIMSILRALCSGPHADAGILASRLSPLILLRPICVRDGAPFGADRVGCRWDGGIDLRRCSFDSDGGCRGAGVAVFVVARSDDPADDTAYDEAAAAATPPNVANIPRVIAGRTRVGTGAGATGGGR